MYLEIYNVIISGWKGRYIGFRLLMRSVMLPAMHVLGDWSYQDWLVPP